MRNVIEVENISKKYQLGVVGTGTLHDDLNRWWHSIRGKADPYAKVGATKESETLAADEILALENISFGVKQGEILGIVGRNGAGKSTLLKILSRVTAPTTGEVRVKGRIASLLEVGTGFHPELTGRENIFLNGAILGMTKAEIKGKLDEIIAFAEIEKFLNTPVKRYSSGMYVRLAFAVAAHLEPEILIVDEVLAVGDYEFQSKCLGKMKDVSSSGRTVLFVSHNLTAVLNLCSRGLLLSGGRIVMTDQVQTVCSAYVHGRETRQFSPKSNGLLQYLSLVDMSGEDVTSIGEGELLRFLCRVRVPEARCLISLIINDMRNAPIFELFDHSFAPPYSNDAEVKLRIDAGFLPLLPGHYSVDFWLGNCVSTRLERLNGVLEFDIFPSVKTKSSATLNGSIKCKSEWICI